ncbi:MAG: hypothetical protein HOE90_20350 [Bacteriovoracaceae bacterium]|jgi:flagellar motor switch protein FliM|nr:hypothetical protein [Bacteriovoracaceae bacterium]
MTDDNEDNNLDDFLSGYQKSKTYSPISNNQLSKFETSLKKNWTGLFRKQVDLEITNQTHVQFKEILASSPTNSAYFLLEKKGGARSKMVILWPELAMGLVDLLLGGKGAGSSTTLNRELSATDFNVLDGPVEAMKLLIDTSFEGWEKSESIRPCIHGSSFINGIMEADVFTLLTYRLEIKECGGEFQIALPV